jgi:hypothetical protein
MTIFLAIKPSMPSLDAVMPVLTDILLYYGLYRFMRWLMSPLWSRQPFEEIPGPNPKSFFSGTHILIGFCLSLEFFSLFVRKPNPTLQSKRVGISSGLDRKVWRNGESLGVLWGQHLFRSASLRPFLCLHGSACLALSSRISSLRGRRSHHPFPAMYRNAATYSDTDLLVYPPQDPQLYISDPVALHAILVKEQDAFEETEVFTE